MWLKLWLLLSGFQNPSRGALPLAGRGRRIYSGFICSGFSCKGFLWHSICVTNNGFTMMFLCFWLLFGSYVGISWGDVFGDVVLTFGQSKWRCSLASVFFGFSDSLVKGSAFGVVC